ncbi:MAG: triphosphoribosyl-dephospho-CoA synthase [Alphaproteobacteria bacterium]
MVASKPDSGGASEAVRRAFEHACLTEIESLKPGNVHMFSGGHGMSAEDFAASARAAGAVIAKPGLGVGGRIEAAVEATWAAVSCNTNLGIVLLCAPLIEAAMTAGPRRDLRARLNAVLDGLTRDDAELAFTAIRRANPAGLGESARHDVRAPARGTLLEAMREAAPRDLIARQYATGFADVFAIGVPRIADTMKRLGRDPAARPWAATAAHLAFMAAFPDTHIVRKHGAKAAEDVRIDAARLESAFRSCAHPASMFDELLAFDKALKARGLNPGTSADLTVASLLAADLPDIFRGQTASRGPGRLD